MTGLVLLNKNQELRLEHCIKTAKSFRLTFKISRNFAVKKHDNKYRNGK